MGSYDVIRVNFHVFFLTCHVFHNFYYILMIKHNIHVKETDLIHLHLRNLQYVKSWHLYRLHFERKCTIFFKHRISFDATSIYSIQFFFTKFKNRFGSINTDVVERLNPKFTNNKQYAYLLLILVFLLDSLMNYSGIINP